MVGAKRKTKEQGIQRGGKFGRFKSGSLRQVFVKTPGGRTIVHYKKKKPPRASCSKCGVALAGTLRELSSKMKNLPKTKKRPERPYGGKLCSRCMRRTLINEARK